MGTFQKKNDLGMVVGDFAVLQKDADTTAFAPLGKSWTVRNLLVRKWLEETDECIVRYTLNPVAGLGGEWYIDYEGESRLVTGDPLEEATQLLSSTDRGQKACRAQVDFEHRIRLDAIHRGGR